MIRSSIKANQGFTLLELIISMAMIAIVGSMAAPSFDQLITKNRQSSALNGFVGALFYARSEAIKTGQTVTVCASVDGNSCSNNAEWNQGWLMFVDANRNTSLDAAETAFKVGGALSDNVTLVGDTEVSDFIRFYGDGTTLDTGTFTFCDNRGSDHAKSIIMSETGRAKVAEMTASGGGLACSA